MKQIVAIVVTYNRKKLLKKNIRCLLNQTYPFFDIMIIDNASTDGTLDEIADLLEKNNRIKYYNTGKNLGGAGGFNYGMRKAVETGYQFIWIMDDDSMPCDDALQTLVSASERIQDYGFLSSKVLWTDGTLCKMNIQRDLKLHNISNFSQPIIDAGAATFVSTFLPAQVVKQVGLPIKDFFIWADDLEYTRRISRKHPCYVVSDSIIIHDCATNNGGNISTDQIERIDRYKYAYRNEVFVYRREGIRGVAHLVLRTPLHILRVLVKSKNNRWRRIKVILGSTMKGLSFHPPIEYIQDVDEDEQ